jgi:hypothetical protein
MAITKWSIQAPSSKKKPPEAHMQSPQARAQPTGPQCQKRVPIEAGHSDSFDQPPSPRRAPGGYAPDPVSQKEKSEQKTALIFCL